MLVHGLGCYISPITGSELFLLEAFGSVAGLGTYISILVARLRKL